MSWLELFRRRRSEPIVSYKDNLVYLVDRALDEAERLLESNPAKSFRNLDHANRLYDHLEDNYGFDHARNTRLNGLCSEYMRRYFPQNAVH